MRRAERNALRRQVANTRKRRAYERGVDADVMARRLLLIARRVVQDLGRPLDMLPHVHTLISETCAATAMVTSPADALLLGVEEVFSVWSNQARKQATSELAERAYGWTAPPYESVATAGAAMAFAARQLPVHRALAVVCKESGYPRLSMRQMKCLGSVLNHRFLRNHLDRQLVGPEVPSVLEAIAAAGLTVTDKIYPELLVPPPEWFDMHEKMGEDAA